MVKSIVGLLWDLFSGLRDSPPEPEAEEELLLPAAVVVGILLFSVLFALVTILIAQGV